MNTSDYSKIIIFYINIQFSFSFVACFSTHKLVAVCVFAEKGSAGTQAEVAGQIPPGRPIPSCTAVKVRSTTQMNKDSSDVCLS